MTIFPSFNLDKYILRPNYWTVCLPAGLCCLLPLKTDIFKPLEADILLLLFLVVFCTEFEALSYWVQYQLCSTKHIWTFPHS